MLCFNIIPVIVDSFKIINSKLTILFENFLRNTGHKLCSSPELSTLSSGNSDAVIPILPMSVHSSLCLKLSAALQRRKPNSSLLLYLKSWKNLFLKSYKDLKVA